LIRHGPHRKQRVQQFSKYCAFVAAVTFFTEPLPGKDRVIHTQTHRMMGRIYEVRWDGLRCHDIHTTFHKVWFGHQKLTEGIQRQRADRSSLFFFKMRKAG
jgi:hypothetical protein